MACGSGKRILGLIANTRPKSGAPNPRLKALRRPKGARLGHNNGAKSPLAKRRLELGDCYRFQNLRTRHAAEFGPWTAFGTAGDRILEYWSWAALRHVVGRPGSRRRRASSARVVTGWPNPIIDRGRATMVVDIHSDDGRAVCMDASDRADVLIEGFRPGVMERLGLVLRYSLCATLG